MIIGLYLTRKYLLALFVISMSILSLIFLIEFETQFSTLSDQDVTFGQTAKLALLITPQKMEKFLPAIFAFSALWMSIRLGVLNEITVIRSSGMAGMFALLAPTVMAFIIGVLLTGLITPAGALMAKRQNQIISAMLGEKNQVFLESSGFFWFRQVLEGRQTMVRASKTNRGMTYEDIHVFMFDENGHLSERIYAKAATLFDDLNDSSVELRIGYSFESESSPGLCLYDYRIWQVKSNATEPAANASAVPVACFEMELTAQEIRDSLDPPQLIPFWQLSSQIASLDLSGFSSTAHRVFMHGQLAKPLLLAAMVLIGSALTLRHTHTLNLFSATLATTLCTLLIVFVHDFARILGEAETIPAAAAAWTTPVAAALLAIGTLSYLEGK